MSTKSQLHNAKSLFLYLGLFFSLGIVAFAIGGVIFQLINVAFPTIISPWGVDTQGVNQNALRASLASLIVGIPFFFIFSLQIRKALNHDQIQASKGPRQWVSYLIMFIVVAIAIGDFIATVNTLLDGDLTARFALKALTILGITGWIFSFFWIELKSENALKKSVIPKTNLISAAVVMLILLVTGFMLIDSPAQNREKAYDVQRVNDLRSIKNAVNLYYDNNGELPTKTDDLRINDDALVDPRTEEPYTYEVISEDQFRLCATFTTNSEEQEGSRPVYDKFDLEFAHETGENCFTITPDSTGPIAPERPSPAIDVLD